MIRNAARTEQPHRPQSALPLDHLYINCVNFILGKKNENN